MRSHRIAELELFSLQPDLRICVSAGHTKKEIEKAGTVIRTAVSRLLTKRR